jgi:hypothetical protein
MNSNLRSITRSVMSGVKSVESGAQTMSTDKNVLYIMLIIAVVTVVGYLMMGNFEAVAFFAIVAYLSTFFTKNMVIVFLISILATNFLMVTKVKFGRKEGMQNPSSDPDSNSASALPSTLPSASPTLPSASPALPSALPSASPSPSPSPSASLPNPTNPTAKPEPKPTNQASAKTSGGKNKEGMNGKLTPANFNNNSEDEGNTNEIEKAHDNLQSIGGGAAMNTAQTDKIMQQQKILMDNMKTMQPFLETAERFLDKFNMKGIDGLLGKIGMNGAPSANPSANAGA